MSIRFWLCLVVALASTSAAARDVKLASAGGGGGSSCPDAAATAEAEPERTRRTSVPGRPVRTKPGLHSDSGSRTMRWHSFLPGMFR